MDNSVRASLEFVNREMRDMSAEAALDFIEQVIEELKVTAKALETDVENARPQDEL